MIIFHHNDPDGLASASVAHKYYGHRSPIFQEVQYGDMETTMGGDGGLFLRNRNVEYSVPGNEFLFLDFHPPEEILRALLKGGVKSILVVDHHVSSSYLEEIEEEFSSPLFTLVREIGTSACLLLQEYLYPEEEVPDLIRYVNDRDVWDWKLPLTKEVNAYIQCQDLVLSHWCDMYDSLRAMDVSEFGRGALEMQKRMVKEITSKMAHKMEFPGYGKIWACESPILQSEIGHELGAKNPESFALVYSHRPDHPEEIRCSLRSEKMDISGIAKSYGGGGHKNAAGFLIPRDALFPQ